MQDPLHQHADLTVRSKHDSYLIHMIPIDAYITARWNPRETVKHMFDPVSRDQNGNPLSVHIHIAG
jgi:hypothetical protein